MTFTESDAQNDGLIKREVGREMAKVAKTQNPQMFQHFENVCEEVGREPAEVFGEMAVRSLNSEQFANQVLNSEVSMGQIKADEIRLEDVRYVKELSEELGLNQSEDSSDPIDQLINQRLEMVTSSPLDNLKTDRENTRNSNGEVLQHMESLQNEIARLEQKIEGEDVEGTVEDTTTEPDEQSVDDLFGDGESDEGKGSEQRDDSDNVVEVRDEGESEEAQAEADEVDQGPTEEEIDEALEGAVDSVDDVWGEDDGEELETEIDIPAETEEDDGIVTSKDGEEE